MKLKIISFAYDRIGNVVFGHTYSYGNQTDEQLVTHLKNELEKERPGEVLHNLEFRISVADTKFIDYIKSN